MNSSNRMDCRSRNIGNSDGPKPAKALNPEFMIGDAVVIMFTQFLSAVPSSALKEQVAPLDQHHTKIVDAIDLLLQGF